MNNEPDHFKIVEYIPRSLWPYLQPSSNLFPI